MKNFSILSLVLLAASAVTAALTSVNNVDNDVSKLEILPSATVSERAGLSCQLTLTHELDRKVCDVTINTGTTGEEEGSSDENANTSYYQN